MDGKWLCRANNHYLEGCTVIQLYRNWTGEEQCALIIATGLSDEKADD